MNIEKKLPRPSVEKLNEFDELCKQTHATDLSSEQYQSLIDQVNDIIVSYDLSNYVFENPATGKKGVKNPAGVVLVPADYDEFNFVGDHNIFTVSHIAAKRGGKYGVVTTDGTGKALCDFRFDYLQWYPYAGLYLARWDGVEGKFGMVNKDGKVFIPNVLTKLYDPWNDFMLLESDGKFGGLDISTFFFVMPEYDNIDAEPDELVVFHKGGVEGYIVEETGEFITKEQYEDDEQYVDAYVYNTYVNL
ncbi:hypothetical protein PRMUPPPA20_08610 [Xylanibacter ruminicola]|uniref:Conserved domain protein n=2 Tax=Xylanibacter ruminicola TaxID=839 RepID=D5EWW2_XYLR2|nr:hypothetical protein [Xylanibacter ruminicola]ADE81699.1 conserved domain protein [Xylanibacter ruminicola 23]GJG32752.1 hypothetical protein PRMUPPPA20_08610 [Xylanibacter ruminicola]SEH95544.1 hypothetical protein SAMN02745192_2464 [Xylanibacter ruminicola]